MSKLRVLDLFSGIGGFSLGLERTGGFETVAFCEIEAFPRKILAQWWPEVPCYDDVRTLTAKRLAADGIAVDVITGGFPCQDISTSGTGEGLAGSRSGLWSEIARLVGELRPSYVIVENVAALLGRGLGTVLGDLAAIGYDAEWHCIPASAVGAPHRRDRVWIIAYPIGSICRSGSSIGNTSDQGRGTCETWREGLQSQDGEACTSYVEPLCEDVAHSDHEGLQGLTGSSLSGGETPDRYSGPKSLCGDRFFQHRRDWSVEPAVCRVANGVPDRSHRLKSLGNAVVPQIPELIGRAILESMAA